MKNLFRTTVVMFVGLLWCAHPALAGKPVEWPISNHLTVDITEFGGISKITEGGKLVTANGQIFVHKPGKEGVIFQGSGFVSGNEVDLKHTDDEVTAHGTLLMDKSGTAKAVEYTVTYKKIADGVMQVRGEVTYLTDSSWSIPAQFSLAFPFAQYTDAQFITLDHESTERTYEIGGSTIKFTGFGFKSATLTKGKQSITIEPVGERSVINFQDSRAWGGDYLRVDFSMKQVWKTPFEFKAGTKQSFEAKLTFKNER